MNRSYLLTTTALFVVIGCGHRPPVAEPTPPASSGPTASPSAAPPVEPQASDEAIVAPAPQAPPCTEQALLPSTRNTRYINHDRTYRLLEPRCLGDFARATIQPADRPDDQIATVLWAYRGSGWQVVTVSTWVQCSELEGEIPKPTCEQLMAD